MTELFGAPNTGGTLQDKINQARTFLDRARGVQPAAEVAAEAVPTEAVHGLVADAPIEAAAAAPVEAAAAAPVSNAAIETGMDAAVPAATTAAGHDPDALAAAARAAAEQSIADPAYAAAATQNVDVVVQPRVLVQGQPGPVVVPVDVAVPAAHTNVTVAPAQAVVLDAATGQPIAAGGGAPAAAAAAAPEAAPTRGFRQWGVEDLLNLGRGGRAGQAASAPAATATTAAAAAEAPAAATTAATGTNWRDQVSDLLMRGRATNGNAGAAATAATEAAAEAPTAAAAAGGGWKSRVEDLLGLPKAAGTGAAAEAATEVAEEAAKPGLLDTIRRNTAGIGEVLTRTAPDASTVIDDAARAAKPGIRAALQDAIVIAKGVK